MKKKFIQAYIDVAERFSQLSTAKRLQVGAIVVKDDRIISIGYNGMPSGWTNDCEDPILWKDGQQLIEPMLVSKPEVLHAETNAIAKLAKSSESGENASLFVTHQPCLECSKLIYQSGISAVYYAESYRLVDGIDFLKKSKIAVTKVERT